MQGSGTTVGRIEWLDCLRGFTMLLVVAYHVAQLCFGITIKTSASLPLLALVRMPLFFFVSGLLAYKGTMLWTTSTLGRQVGKKVVVQLVPTVVFLCIFLVVRTPHFWPGLQRALASPTKDGYWYTWALLVMFVIYYLFAFLEQRLRLGSWAIWTLWLVSLLVYETAFMPKYFTFPKSTFMAYSSFIQVVYYFHFFLFGNLVRRHQSAFDGLMDSRWFFPCVAAVAFVCAADVLKWHTLHAMWTNLPRTLAMYSLMLLVVMAFRHHSHTFSRHTWAGRTLRFIGMRTLDIYLMHFIFMPRLPEVGKWFDAHQPNPLLEQTACLLLALLVTCFCCLASGLLRTSPVLRKYLFGRVKREN